MIIFKTIYLEVINELPKKVSNVVLPLNKGLGVYENLWLRIRFTTDYHGFSQIDHRFFIFKGSFFL